MVNSCKINQRHGHHIGYHWILWANSRFLQLRGGATGTATRTLSNTGRLQIWCLIQDDDSTGLRQKQSTLKGWSWIGGSSHMVDSSHGDCHFQFDEIPRVVLKTYSKYQPTNHVFPHKMCALWPHILMKCNAKFNVLQKGLLHLLDPYLYLRPTEKRDDMWKKDKKQKNGQNY